MKIVFDIEADGLLDTITRVHCLVAKDIDSGRIYRFFDGDISKGRGKFDLYLKDIPRIFSVAELVIGHNIIRYDLQVLKLFYDIDPSFEIRDTYIWSKALNPDREIPAACPPTLFNPITGKHEKIGPHSLAAWGYRVGRGKPEYFDWDEFDEQMLFRCQEDVEINELTYYELLKEADISC